MGEGNAPPDRRIPIFKCNDRIGNHHLGNIVIIIISS